MAEKQGKGERLLLAFPPQHPCPQQGPHHSHTGRGGHVLVGVLAEDVLDDHDGFLHHIVDLGLDEIQQRAHTALCRLLWGEEMWARPLHPLPTEPLMTMPWPRAQPCLDPFLATVGKQENTLPR